VVLGVPFAALTIAFAGRGRASVSVDLTYSAGRLSWPSGSTRAAIGKGGVRTAKRESETPATRPGMPTCASAAAPPRWRGRSAVRRGRHHAVGSRQSSSW